MKHPAMILHSLNRKDKGDGGRKSSKIKTTRAQVPRALALEMYYIMNLIEGFSPTTLTTIYCIGRTTLYGYINKKEELLSHPPESLDRPRNRGENTYENPIRTGKQRACQVLSNLLSREFTFTPESFSRYKSHFTSYLKGVAEIVKEKKVDFNRDGLMFECHALSWIVSEFDYNNQYFCEIAFTSLGKDNVGGQEQQSFVANLTITNSTGAIRRTEVVRVVADPTNLFNHQTVYFNDHQRLEDSTFYKLLLSMDNDIRCAGRPKILIHIDKPQLHMLGLTQDSLIIHLPQLEFIDIVAVPTSYSHLLPLKSIAKYIERRVALDALEESEYLSYFGMPYLHPRSEQQLKLLVYLWEDSVNNIKNRSSIYLTNAGY
ncbi:hypothetical protein BGZ76_004797 [Entomortierella beljakovae]|nr:hypothetical protein BGZ76_004797 [Entomortierella beljakovae]